MRAGDCVLCDCRTLEGRLWLCHGCGGKHVVCSMCGYHCGWRDSGTEICPEALRVAHEVMGEGVEEIEEDKGSDEITNFDTSYAALYYPWIVTKDPNA